MNRSGSKANDKYKRGANSIKQVALRDFDHKHLSWP